MEKYHVINGRAIYRVFDEEGNVYLVNSNDDLDAMIAVAEKYPESYFDEAGDLTRLESEVLFDYRTKYKTVIEDN